MQTSPVRQAAPNLATCSIAEFAAAVLAATSKIGKAKTERYGGRKVFVSAVWRELSKTGASDDLSLDSFKRRLLDAVRTGDLQMARADLVGAMNAATVKASEINDLGSSFHFVLDPNGRDPWEVA